MSVRKIDSKLFFRDFGYNEITNIDVVRGICDILDELVPQKPLGIQSYSELIEFVSDRPGHDQRYAIDASKVSADLGWKPIETFDSGLRKTVTWFLENEKWCDRVISADYLLVEGKDSQP
jgi:dTDP-glucose 4,6-dehydratase